MASKKVVVDLDLQGNAINSPVINNSTLNSPVLSTDVLSTPVAGELAYDSGASVKAPKYHDGTNWQVLAKNAQITEILTMLSDSGSVGSKIKANTDFRTYDGDSYSSILGAMGAVLDGEFDVTLSGNNMVFGLAGNEFFTFDATAFVKDGMLSGAHVISRKNSVLTYDNNGTTTTITPGTTSVDGKVVTTTESGYPSTDGQYMRFVFNVDRSDIEPSGEATNDNKSAMWISLQALVDTYSAGNGLSLSAGNAFSVNNGNGLDFDNNGKLKVKLDGSTLSVGANGLKLSDTVNQQISYGFTAYEERIMAKRVTVNNPNTPTQAGGTTKNYKVTVTSDDGELFIVSAKAYIKDTPSSTKKTELVVETEVSDNYDPGTVSYATDVTFTWNINGLTSSQVIILEVAYGAVNIS